MPFLRFSFFLLFSTSSILLAQDSNNILSDDRLKVFEYEKKQNKEDSSKLKKDWINPIIYSLTKNYTEDYTTSKSMVSISQPIFKSGGIYAAIKYANALEKYSSLSIDLSKKAMIKDATSLLFQINKANLAIKKQELLLKNTDIDVQRKKEQVFNGFLDTSYLDNAILASNTNKNLLAQLKYEKQTLINNFSNLASKSYKEFTLPTLKLVNEEDFLNNNIDIKKSSHDINTKYQLRTMTMSQYLPTLSASYDYAKYHDTDNNPTLYKEGTNTYALKLQIPIDIRAFNDIESSKISYLKAKIAKQNLVIEQKNFFKSQKAKIQMIDDKKVIATSDYKLYNSLLNLISEEQQAGLKTQSDVDTLRNSQNIKSLEIKILNYEKQIELLEIYAHIN